MSNLFIYYCIIIGIYIIAGNIILDLYRYGVIGKHKEFVINYNNDLYIISNYYEVERLFGVDIVKRYKRYFRNSTREGLYELRKEIKFDFIEVR